MAPRIVRSLELDALPRGQRHDLALETVADGLARDILLPVVVVQGATPGPVLGLTAAIHGNELNGLPAIHRLLDGLDPRELTGTLVCVPVVNVPGYHAQRREFSDGVDLNRVFPGKEGGTQSQVFAARVADRLLTRLTHLVDLHTASFGRVNTLYARADLNVPEARELALCIEPQILLHNRGVDGTFRDAAMDLGVIAVTLEVGNPQRIQDDLVLFTVAGLTRVMSRLGMVDRDPVAAPPGDPVVCGRSYWIHTDRGGILEVFPPLAARVRQGERVAQVRDVYGRLVREYFAPEDGIVIGKSTNPVNQTGSRILHLGILGDPQVAPVAPDA